MAITSSSHSEKKQRQLRIQDFVLLHNAKQSWLIVAIAVIFSAILMLGLLLTGILSPQSPYLWIIGLLSIALNVVGGVAIATFAARPGRDLLTAVAHAANEPVFLPLASPTDTKYRYSGFDTALKTIYALSGNVSADQAEGTHDVAVDTPPQTEIPAALGRMHGAIITLNHNHSVNFASQNAPLVSGEDNELKPRLLFTSDSLDTWLEECEERAVKAERVWRRIPDRPANQEGQRIYDIFASYEKGAEHETVLTLVDQTAFYEADEGDLNFIAFAAHELRGPITVIRGYLDVLQEELDSVLQEDQKELFRRLTVSANRLSSYVNNILNTSRYDQRHLSVSLIEDSLASIYGSISDDMELRAAAQHRLLTVDIPDTLPLIAADRGSLSEVLSNLIDNAIKYSNEGGSILVGASQKGDFVEVTVQDFGIGMPSNVVGNLFQKFYRSHRSRETVAGSGIGLYISKAIVESHGGTISVQSAEGKGSTFTVLIPTYASVAEKLQVSNNSNQDLIKQGSGWIKNHSMYRG